MLEGRKITSQQTIVTVLQEKKLNLLPSTNVMCIENHCSPSSSPPIFVWLSEVVGISVGFMLDSKGYWKHGGGMGVDAFINAFILIAGVKKVNSAIILIAQNACAWLQNSAFSCRAINIVC